MDLFDIAAKISLNTKDYEKALAGADKQGASFAQKLKSGLSTAAKIGATAIGAVASGIGAISGKFVSGMKDVATYGDEVDKMSQKLGLSKTAYQEWDYVLGQAGVEITSMSTGLKTLTNKLDEAKNGSEDAQKMFAALGLSMEDLSTMSREDVFASVITGFQGMADSTERAALANDLFGRSGQELTPLFNSSIKDTNELRKAAHDLGFVLSDEAVGASADFNDALDTLTRTIKGIKNQFLQNFLPAATKVMDGLTAIFGGDSSSGVGMIKKGIEEIINSLSEKIPEFLDIGWGIVDALLTAITENLPMLIEKGADMLLNGVIPGILDNLPMLVETAFQIIAQLATSIGQALPELIPAAVSMIIQIVESLLDNIDLLIDAAVQLVMGLVDGIVQAIPILIEKGPEIVIKLVEAIIRNLPKIVKAGFELIGKLISGIVQSFGKLIGSGGDIVNKIGEGIKNVWNNFIEWAGGIISKIGEGIKNAWEKIKEFGSSIVEKIGEGIKSIWDNFKEWAGNIIEKIASGLREGFEKIKEIGANLVKGLWEGIKNTASWLWDKVSGWASNLFGKIKGFFGIHSPSTEMEWIGEMFDKGLAKGIEKYSDQAVDAATSMGDDVMDAMDGLSGSAKFAVGYKSDRMARAFGNNAFNPAAALAGGVPINLYIDGDKWVGSTDSRMDRNLGQIQKIKARYGGA